ncbi:MAG: integrin [Planctomycetes bacterium]|nr:integrin [Planctomycetota bacterium]
MAAPRSTKSTGGRVSREWDGRITEWYINDTRGLEHGYTVASRPMEAREPLTLDLSIRGGLRPMVSGDGRHVVFTDAQGGSILHYNNLTVLDASGATVPARWYPLGDQALRLRVDDSVASYPLTIDPVAQQAYVKASNPGLDDEFGGAVALSGNTLVVAARFEDSAATGVNGNPFDNSASGSGAVYVFAKQAGTWVQEAYLKASNAQAGDLFGTSVAISGDTIVVGAHVEDSNATGIGGNQANNTVADSGAVYVFVRNAGAWSQQAYIKASNTGAGDNFGLSVAISGDTMVVGAPFEDSNAAGVNGDQNNESGQNFGAAYVFVRNGAVWSQQAYLKASNPGGAVAGDNFGHAVSISADTILVGAYAEDSNATGVNGDQNNNTAVDSGAAYVFVRNGGIWSQQAYLKASNTGSNDFFGWAVAVSGDTIAVGAYSEDSNSTGINGAQNNNLASGSGAVYLFQRVAGLWSQEAYVKASNTGSNDQFGRNLALSGEILAVGARSEDSNASGIGGDPLNNSSTDSGATYVLRRAGGVWSQIAYLKASNSESFDQFGWAVGVSGALVVSTSVFEASNSSGINGNQSNNSLASGAAYLFDLDLDLGTVSYGTGTPGCAGTHELGVTHAPMLNSPQFEISCNNAPPSSLGLGIIANAQDLAGSDPFFIGVLLHVDLFAATETTTLDFLSDASGNAVAAVPIPNASALVGDTYYAMALWVWTSCSLPPYNLSTSKGLALTVLTP